MFAEVRQYFARKKANTQLISPPPNRGGIFYLNSLVFESSEERNGR